ncbi:MAG: hypothetical protein ACKVP4_14210 [Hyphomicrobium sp.]
MGSNPTLSANRLASAGWAYGSQIWTYDGVGNRTSEAKAGVRGSLTFPATSNRLQSIARAGSTIRALTCDGAEVVRTDQYDNRSCSVESRHRAFDSPVLLK